MVETLNRKGVWGWMLFDVASQPFHTLLVTFIFAPYFTAYVAEDPTQGQAIWGFTTAAAGLIIAFLAPVLGAMADTTGPRKPWIAAFSILYVLGSFSLWFALPGMSDTTFILLAFAIGLIGVEFATTFSNAILPELAPRRDIGQISGSGWAMGYVGGLLVLIFVLLLVQENESGVTLLGNPPIGGLDAELREGTRSVGPMTAVWYVVFMIPFFMWVPDAARIERSSGAVRAALVELRGTILNLPKRPSFMNYLLASMFYRDALVGGLYAFGGIFAAGVLGWSITQIGIFGIIALITGALGAWIGGRADRAYGPKPVVYFSIFTLLFVAIVCIGTSRTSVFGMTVDPTSSLPDSIFYVCGALIGAMGGSLQAASRTMLVHLADQDRMTEAFGLYALTGKATSFLAPFAIGVMTTWTGSQQLGIFIPVIVLFLIGIVFLMRVNSFTITEPLHASP